MRNILIGRLLFPPRYWTKGHIYTYNKPQILINLTFDISDTMNVHKNHNASQY